MRGRPDAAATSGPENGTGGEGDKALTAVIAAFARDEAHESGSAAQFNKDADAYVKARRDLAAVPIPAPPRGLCR